MYSVCKVDCVTRWYLFRKGGKNLTSEDQSGLSRFQYSSLSDTGRFTFDESRERVYRHLCTTNPVDKQLFHAWSVTEIFAKIRNRETEIWKWNARGYTNRFFVATLYDRHRFADIAKRRSRSKSWSIHDRVLGIYWTQSNLYITHSCPVAQQPGWMEMSNIGAPRLIIDVNLVGIFTANESNSAFNDK